MVWAGTPEAGRRVAAGIALLAWAALSVLALRGLSLSPAAFIQVHTEAPHPPEVRAEIHLPKTEPASYQQYSPQQPPPRTDRCLSGPRPARTGRRTASAHPPRDGRSTVSKPDRPPRSPPTRTRREGGPV
ncbi:hypothetical protein [Streptomyces spirodelae]|uniref:Uncharacterized protein n=1 Tax=Streptomyces spirodelae TaxID=2812904 RepID=A0ABS3X1J5_9ACTN|nr:hypothetical protein [Streptomyces spirodelae]MBO8189226.1 hypothetical protein [Streptomyces spirodelae]